MIRPFKNLSTLSTGMWYKSALMLMPYMPEQSALEVEATAAFSAPEFECTFRRLAHGINVMLLRIIQPFQPGNTARA